MIKLEELGIRKTPLNINLYEAFHDETHAICANDLKKLITVDYNQASLYRAINRFLLNGIIKVIFIHEKDGAYYQLSTYHRHYIVCRECGAQEKLSQCSIGPMINDAKKLGFVNLEHRLEINGECLKCS